MSIMDTARDNDIGEPAKGRRSGKPPYFLRPGPQGTVAVFRRPSGNRAEPKECGTMSSRELALALVRQLQKAETVVQDLFLEATDDGIEALEAILEACRVEVQRRGATSGRRGPARRGRRRPPRQ
jgi:hypothetical protein